MSVQRVFVDANVLASRVQRDWLFLIGGEVRMFDTYISEDVLAETIRAHRRRHPDADGGEITRLRSRLVNAADHMVDDFPGALTFVGADTHDQHVHAAAAACGAHKLLTCDTGFLGLDDALMDQLPYEPWHPDDFFLLVNDSAPHAVRAVVQEQMRYWLKQDGGTPELAGRLQSAQCPGFASVVRSHLAALSGPGGLRAYERTLLLEGTSAR
ncbi:PIN domain-containing protein [Microbacterium sp. NPDC087665]|uniref:PIN domain-containing protein n=1 Tax=Microbacterium sp. NPDC087665 TaxID=3364194 RepID=UPI0037F6CD72